MKNIVIRLSLMLALLVTSTTTLRAQSGDVVTGTFTISLDPTLWALLDANGITTTLGPSLANVPHHDTILTGIFDMPTGSGYFNTKGQLKFTGPDGEVVTVLQLGLDTTGATPAVYGTVYADSYYRGRQVIFNITTTNPLNAPLHPTNPANPRQVINNSPAILASLSPYFQTLLGTSFHTSVLLGYRGYSTLHTSIILSQ